MDDDHVALEVKGQPVEKKPRAKKSRKNHGKKKTSAVHWMFSATEDPTAFRCKLADFAQTVAGHKAVVKVGGQGKSTSNLLAHARTYHATILDGLVKAYNENRDVGTEFQNLLLTLRKPGTPGSLDHHVTVVKRSEKALRVQVSLLNFLIANSLPFSLIDSVYFEQFCKEVGVALPSEGSVLKLLDPLYMIVMESLERKFRDSGLFSITFDLWTSVAKQKYMAVTYHSMTATFEPFDFVLDLVPFACAA